ncbi:pyridoxamine 5'-phosphate oxidase family protein [uncultured Maribacter sp.]|uniref:pyridoxamine 5'-phosphate oxidase family protein n=1 Tax=uncultured Maribacter sp. TaxID=431308 RepID=UPI002619C0BE|nr:pyridoxamine 5'-phosphate oxidase family protein [uncultured Maribacter sp.]
MTNLYLQEIMSELKLAVTERNHPLKFCVLGSIGSDNSSQTRIIGLRKITNNLTLTFYTDERSNKVSQILKNPNVSLLFYHPEKKMQIKIDGKASIVKDQDLLKEKWLNINSESKKDYTTTKAPGSILENPSELTFLKEKNYFCIIEVKTKTVEYLKLRETSHFKVLFNKDINGWTSQFLVP